MINSPQRGILQNVHETLRRRSPLLLPLMEDNELLLPLRGVWLLAGDGAGWTFSGKLKYTVREVQAGSAAGMLLH